jgi:hypothetical protein
MPNKAFVKENKGEDTFTVQLFYHPKITEILNKIDGKEYNAEQRFFTIPKKSIEFLIERLVNLNIVVQEVDQLPDQKPVPKIAFIKQSSEMEDHNEVLIKYSPKMVQIFKEAKMKYNHDNGSWVIDRSGLGLIREALIVNDYKIEEVDEFDASSKPKIKVKII